ncbi:hypothetical protein AC578_9227 [Pseudocercospora eumusae]|uniref:AP complex mu/sigma subunit domain-containing protein n=1 Tax=Pseudocercospora eumusae TaxID=321146 RepID=A0A139HNM3_9PEZI|nr:hypothetical protein AC578_9227 [Pseudocercospora eumusae]
MLLQYGERIAVAGWILANAAYARTFAASTQPGAFAVDLILQPEPTPPPTLHSEQHLIRRDGIVDSEQSTLCGWKTYNASQPLQCDESYFCNADSSGNFGCCPSNSANSSVANPCGYATTCYESTCGERCQSDAFAMACISDSYFTNYDCDTTSGYGGGVQIAAPQSVENTTSTLDLTRVSPGAASTTTDSASTNKADPRANMINAVLVFNNNGQPRLTKFYTQLDTAVQQRLISEIFTLVSARTNSACNFLPLPPLLASTSSTDSNDAPSLVTYRHYATLYFIVISTSTESPLALLDLIQVFVEALDRLFENVCELDLIFNFETLHAVLGEMIVGGVVVETGLERVVEGVKTQGRVAKRPVNESSRGAGIGLWAGR